MRSRVIIGIFSLGLLVLTSFIVPAPAQAAWMEYRIGSAQPYKLFTSPQADLDIIFPEGWRADHRVHLDYTVYDIWQNTIAQGSSDFDVPGSGQVARPMPAIVLPRMGWYRLDTSLTRLDGTLLSRRTNLICRTFDDPAVPIPYREFSGWNDMVTHKMIGMGLQRFTVSKLDDLPTLALSVAAAKRLQIPYFYQLTYKADVTPQSVRAILNNQPDLPLLEIMNEPDQQGVSPEDYVKQYLKPCYEEAHRLQPQIQIMGPTKCGIELPWMDRFFKAGGGKYVDAISVHTYERNNSMDAYHWNWKLAKLKEMMTAAGCGDKPIYQSEHGYLGNYHDYILRPQWQARSVFEEYLCFDRVGSGPDRFFYYYVNEAGYPDFSAELVDHDRELYPAALMMRARAHLLQGTHFDSTLDLGPVGNRLVLANRYDGPDADVIILMNTGADRDIDLSMNLPPGAKVYDCWSNPAAPATGQLAIGMFPTYVAISHGASVTAALPWSEQDIAPAAHFVVDDPQAQASVDRLTNGVLEFDFNDEPIREGMAAQAGRLPLDLTARWETPRTIDHVILYGSLADNGHCSPLDYDLEAHVDGSWRKIDSVRVPTEAQILKGGATECVTSYANPWIFLHEFAPVTTDAIRFHFLRATVGQYPTQTIYQELLNTRHIDAISPAVQLREVQIFSSEAH